MVAVRLLAGGLAPMMAIIALRIAHSHWGWTAALAVAALASVASVLRLLDARRATNEQPMKVAAVATESPQVAAYLLSYILPLASLSPQNGWDLAAFGLFFLLLVIVILRTDLILANPILLAAGVHLFSVKSETGWQGLVLSRAQPSAGQVIQTVAVTKQARLLIRIEE